MQQRTEWGSIGTQKSLTNEYFITLIEINWTDAISGSYVTFGNIESSMVVKLLNNLKFFVNSSLPYSNNEDRSLAEIKRHKRFKLLHWGRPKIITTSCNNEFLNGMLYVIFPLKANKW